MPGGDYNLGLAFKVIAIVGGVAGVVLTLLVLGVWSLLW